MHANTARPAALGGARSGIPGTVYLLCIEAPGLHVTGNRYARHYIGWTPYVRDVALAHIGAEIEGHGSALVRAAAERGLAVHLARMWQDRDEGFCKSLRRRSETPALCPTCAGELAYRRAR